MLLIEIIYYIYIDISLLKLIYKFKDCTDIEIQSLLLKIVNFFLYIYNNNNNDNNNNNNNLNLNLINY